MISDGKPVEVIDAGARAVQPTASAPCGWIVLVAAVVAIARARDCCSRTRFGTHLLATGGSPEAATVSGTDARVKIAVYGISGALAGFAACCWSARDRLGRAGREHALLLNAVAAVVLGGVSLFGGRATIIGPVLGALLLTALVNGLTLLGVSQFYQPLSVGIVVVLAAFLTRFQR